MMNKIFLIGNVGRIESKPNNDGTMSKFTLAVNRKHKDQDITTWFDCVAFGKLGDLCSKYVGTGSKMMVVGRVDINKYKNKEGIDKVGISVVVSEVEFLSQKKEDAPPIPADPYYNEAF
jgi:single-strand DNA-binding protein